MECPDCDGTTQVVASHVSYSDGTSGFNVPFPCTRCNGTGEVDDCAPEWIRVGRLMREYRVNGGNYRNLMTEAKRRDEIPQ